MAVKLLLLKSGEMLISDVTELVKKRQTTPYGYVLDFPHTVTTKPKDSTNQEIDIVFSPWIVISKETKMTIPNDWVVTIVDPMDDIGKMYIDDMEKVKSKVENTEDENVS